MVAPATLGTASLGLQIAGLAGSTVGSYYEARAKKSALRAQAIINDINAKMSETRAQEELIAGKEAFAMSTLGTAATKGAQTAAIAAKGIDLTSTSAQNVLLSTDWAGSIEAKNIQTNALRAAWGHRTTAMNYRNEALMQRAGAKSTNVLTSAATTLIGGAGTVAQNWYKMYDSGTLGDTKQTLAGGNSAVNLRSGRSYA